MYIGESVQRLNNRDRQRREGGITELIFCQYCKKMYTLNFFQKDCRTSLKLALIVWLLSFTFFVLKPFVSNPNTYEHRLPTALLYISLAETVCNFASRWNIKMSSLLWDVMHDKLHISLESGMTKDSLLFVYLPIFYLLCLLTPIYIYFKFIRKTATQTPYFVPSKIIATVMLHKAVSYTLTSMYLHSVSAIDILCHYFL